MRSEALEVRVADVIRRGAERHPERVALRHDGRTLTYAQLDARSSRLAQALLASGVRAGDRVAYLGRDAQVRGEPAQEGLQLRTPADRVLRHPLDDAQRGAFPECLATDDVDEEEVAALALDALADGAEQVRLARAGPTLHRHPERRGLVLAPCRVDPAHDLVHHALVELRHVIGRGTPDVVRCGCGVEP